MTDWDRDAWENALIADMRAHDGNVTTGPMAGRPILILTATGARSGQPRRVVLNFHRDGDDYVVAGTAGGSPREPRWVGNVAANPEVSVEAGNRVFRARGTVIAGGAERDRLWDAHVAALPWFGDYATKTERVIPMVRLTEADAG